MAQLYNNDTIGKSYQEQLGKEHHGSKWGTTGAKYAGRDIVELLETRPYIKTVLDFGAGKGTMGAFIRDKGFDVEWTNYDPAIPEYNQLPDRQFDLVLSTDVLEHVEPEKLPTVIKTLTSLTGKVLYSDIACYPTGKVFGEGPYKGQDLHLIVEVPNWWRFQFQSYCPLKELIFRSTEKSNGKTRCMMIHERV